MEIIRHIGAFAYPATIKQRYGYDSERPNLMSRMEYEFVSVASSEVQPDAIVASAGDGGGAIYFKGWLGRLWLPLRDLKDGSEIPIAEYVAGLGRYGRYMSDEGEVDDPMDHQHDRRMSRHPRRDLFAEGDFIDKVEWSGRAASIALHKAACERLLVIDGIVHYRSDGPVWLVERDANVPVMLRMDKPWSRRERYRADTFRADRLESAVEFRCRISGFKRGDSVGEILDVDTNYMTRNDLSHGLDRRLSTSVGVLENQDGYHIRAVSLFSPEALSAWRRLLLELDRYRPFRIEGLKNPIETLADIDVVLPEMDVRSMELSDWDGVEKTSAIFRKAKAFAAWARSLGWSELEVDRPDDSDQVTPDPSIPGI